MSFILNAHDYLPPAQLTGFVRAALADLPMNEFMLAQWLPNVTVDDIQYEFLKGAGGLANAAGYRAYDAESEIGKREGIAKMIGELPPISRKIPLNEYDRLRLRRLDNSELEPFITRDAVRMARDIAARFEVARGDAIFNGSVTINENGVKQTIPFGRTGGHAVTVADLWSDADDSTPLDDLETSIETYLTTNGELPGAILMSRSAWAYFRRSAQVRGQVFPHVTTMPMVSGEQARTVLEAQDFPPVFFNDAKVNVAGSATRITPVNKVALLPAPGPTEAAEPTPLGGTFIGTTLEATDPDYSIPAGQQAGIVAGSYESTDPKRLWTKAAAIGVPIEGNADLTFVLTVA